MTKTKRNKDQLVKAVRKAHRLFGLLLSILFFVWCLSGFVMMYKSFPKLTNQEHLEIRPELKSFINFVIPKTGAFLKINPDSIADIRVFQVWNKPILNIIEKNGIHSYFHAISGTPLNPFEARDAPDIVYSYFGNKVKIKRTEILFDLDQWIPRTHFLHHLPIYKVYFDDSEGTVCYVSSQSGEIIQKLNFNDQVWAWLGAIPHWLYFKDLRIHTPLWRGIVIGLSILGIILAIAGIILGGVRTAQARQRNKTLNPFKKKWFKWHHYLGFFFGLFIFTWMLSGLFSMNPWHWASGSQLHPDEIAQWQGTNISLYDIEEFIGQAIHNLKSQGQLKEVKFALFNSNYYLLGFFGDMIVRREALNPNLAGDENSLFSSIKSRLSMIKPNNNIIEEAILDDYDSYYYDRHRSLALPVYRFKFDDNFSTWYYVDPKTLSIVKKSQNDSRMERWLYHGLHSFDFPQLFYSRPLWDITVIVLLLGCSLLSFTGVRLTLIWFKRKMQ